MTGVELVVAAATSDPFTMKVLNGSKALPPGKQAN
jgi:hypothetical protein